jgi:hypothetical protein
VRDAIYERSIQRLRRIFSGPEDDADPVTISVRTVRTVLRLLAERDELRKRVAELELQLASVSVALSGAEPLPGFRTDDLGSLALSTRKRVAELEARLASVRHAVLEEAARLAETHPQWAPIGSHQSLAAAIRALAEKERET